MNILFFFFFIFCEQSVASYVSPTAHFSSLHQIPQNANAQTVSVVLSATVPAMIAVPGCAVILRKKKED